MMYIINNILIGIGDRELNFSWLLFLFFNFYLFIFLATIFKQ